MTEKSVQEAASVGKSEPVFRQVSVADITPNPDNPRRRLSEVGLEELAASIAEKGVLQPILVRPVASGALQIVAGERRWRAAKVAGLETVPARVANLTDDEALEIAVIENLQREDVHPLDEAAGFEALLKHGHDVAGLAAKVAKSEAHVYQRLKLLSLSKKCQAAFLDDKIPASTALVLARIPSTKLQDEALKRVEGMNSAEAASTIRHQFMLELSAAPFKIDDEALVPEAGSCLRCPKRTGNQQLLFADLKSRDLCTDPPCFQKKRDAGVERRLAEARSSGHTVLSAAEVKTLAPHGYPTSKSGYVSLDEYDFRHGKTLRQAAGKKAIDALPPENVVLAPVKRHDGSTEIKELVPRAIAKKLAPTPKKPAGASRSRADSKVAADGAARRERARIGAVAVERVLAAAQNHDADLEFLRWLAVFDFSAFMRTSPLVIKACGVKKPEDLKKKLPSLGERPLVGLLTALALDAEGIDGDWAYGQGYPEILTAACKVFGVDLPALERELQVEAEPVAKATKKGAKSAAKKPARKAAKVRSSKGKLKAKGRAA